MKYRWMGITGLAFVLAALVGGSLGPSLWPHAFWSGQSSPMMGQGIMNGSMMNGGMMNGGMMGAGTIADSARPELRDLAQGIITGQQREIDQMRQWHQNWYGTANSGSMPGMMNGGMMGGAMTNRDQMRQMMGANADFDRMFLQMMIPHHETAIAMAQQALAQAEHPESKMLAQGIITTQRAEITEMHGYLTQ